MTALPCLRVALVFLLLVACAPRGQITLDPQAAEIGLVQSVFVGTTREIDPKTGRFGGNRSEKPSFARYDVSVPPDRDLGKIVWPRRHGAPDPRRDFLTTAEVIHPDAAAFRADLTRALTVRSRGTRDAVIFVHGFNTNFSEGLYRIAQLSNDLQMPGVTVHYSWPSAGSPLGYVYDRDSALFARDGLEELIVQVAAAGAERILLVAHSMGSGLAMEALRQVAIRGDARLKSRIAGVILISPDLDVDVFRAQALEIGTLPQPFLIFGSDRDRLLNLSARLTGEPARLGNMKNVSRVADLKVTYLDVAAYASGAGHFPLGNSPALISLMAGIGNVDAAFAAELRGRTGLLPGVVLTVQSATEVILAPMTAIAGEMH
ncbi:MAG: alpha/beta fold hydrolase [Pseudorhodobacter sp.]|nr:alpha/beta fold hydrolase [Pseudorhodobacter sp.]